MGRRGGAGSSDSHGHEQVLIKKGSGGATALDTSTAESSYGDETTENTASVGKDLARAPEVRRGVSPVGPEVPPAGFGGFLTANVTCAASLKQLLNSTTADVV